MLSFAFPLPIITLGPDRDVARAVAQALSSEHARKVFDRWTLGAIRYRIAWASGGKRRARIFDIAEEVGRRFPKLINDPTESTWEAVVYEAEREVLVELAPRFEDPRFVYRTGDVPAASHPTLAAALVRVAGVRSDDVVWDPFVGSGMELCERALAGPYRKLIGTDDDPAALEVARANLDATGAHDVVLNQGDATSYTPPERPTLVLTNPPMGRRVLRGVDLGAFFERFLEHAGEILDPGGRLAWISPMPERTLWAAQRLGLAPILQRDIDMGGFEAQIQVFVGPAYARRQRAQSSSLKNDALSHHEARRRPPRRR